jgi:hypothetical protein
MIKGTEKTLLTVQSKTVAPFLIRLNEPRFTRNHSSSLTGLRQIHIEPTDVLRCKGTVYGLNGLRPIPRPRDGRVAFLLFQRSCFILRVGITIEYQLQVCDVFSIGLETRCSVGTKPSVEI